jgi:hypothetical protein
VARGESGIALGPKAQAVTGPLILSFLPTFLPALEPLFILFHLVFNISFIKKLGLNDFLAHRVRVHKMGTGKQMSIVFPSSVR